MTFKLKPHTACDFYKIGHKDMYEKGTTQVYSNFTPRSSKLASKISEVFDDKVVFFGLQGFIRWFLIDTWNEEFFNKSKSVVVEEYRSRVANALALDNVDVSHIEALHDLGYLPIKIKALEEGELVNMKIPVLTITNTLPEFFWLPNYLESIMSSELWKSCTTATTAYQYRKLLDLYADKTGSPKEFVQWQGHDFSFRGLSGLHDAATSAAGHLLSFTGTDTIPAIDYLEDYYFGKETFIGGSVPACYDDQTEILTSKGFKLFSELDKSEKVAQYHEDGSVDFVTPNDWFKDYYNGDMIKFSKDGYGYYNVVVTPNHRMIRKFKDNRLEFFEAGSGVNFSSKTNQVVSGFGIGDQELTAVERLKIAFQADGSFPVRKDEYTGVHTGTMPIRFSLKKERKAERIRLLCEEAGYEYTESKYENGYYSFWVKCKEQFVKDFSWVELSNKSKNWAVEFINELANWDGCTKNNTIVYANTCKNSIDIVQSIACIADTKTKLNSSIDVRGDRKELYTVTFMKNKTSVCGGDVNKETIPYRGYVYCVSVPTKMLVVRRAGVVSVCGNTEHSVTCLAIANKEAALGSKLLAEQEFMRNLITNTHPEGVVSLVSDSFSYWDVITKIAPALKKDIMSRQPNTLGLNKVVFRPDSGDPVNIICGDVNAPEGSPEHKGSIECLWEIFGGTITSTGHKLLDQHVGLIYGDSITLARANEIMKRLEAKGFASANVVFGVGSFTYQYQTRDSYGFAMKATYGVVNGEGREIFKDPKTDSGTKKSAKGLLRVEKENGDYVLYDQQTIEQEQQGELKVVFEDGKLVKQFTLEQIRKNLLK